MSWLLLKRLARSLWRNKIRLVSVLLLVFASAFAGVTFGGYATSIEPIYDVIYADQDDGSNLADVWIDTKTKWWSTDETTRFCARLRERWPPDAPSLDQCEGRLVTNGTLFHTRDGTQERIGAVWHGIPSSGRVDRIWFPSGHSQGRAPRANDEVVIDAHVASSLGIALEDEIVLGAGNGQQTFRVVGIAFHPMHIYFVPEGALFPPELGKFVVGYLSETGLNRLLGDSPPGHNQILLDLEGTPSFDLPDTPADEGGEMRTGKALIASMLRELKMPGRIRDRGETEAVEFMRQDLEGAKKTSTPFALMIALIASITLLLSMQRLVQSQAREIAILRTLGIPRRAVMTAYLLAPLGIGAVGSLGGALLGPVGMNALLDLYESLIGVPVLQRHVPPTVYFSVSISVIGVVFLAGIWPAWKCSRLDPLRVLGGQDDVRLGSMWLQKWTRWMPSIVGLSLRSSLRKPMRLVMTFLAIGVSLMLFGSIKMMAGGMEEILIGGLEKNQRWDVQLFVRPDAETPLLQWARAHDARAERLLELPIGQVEQEPGGGRNVTLVALEGYGGPRSLRSVRLEQGRHPTFGRKPLEVMVDQGILAMNRWALGGVHSVRVGAQTVEVEVVGVTEGELARTLYFDLQDLQELTGVSATAILLALPPNTSINEEVLSQSSGFLERASLLQGMKKMLAQQSQMLRSMMGFGLFLAAIVMFNTLLMNMSERDRELATLRVLGASSFRLSMMLMLEALGIGLVGGLVGVLFAFGGAVGLASAFSTWQFYFPIVVDPEIAGELVLAVLVISLLTTPLGMWRLRRMNLVEKIKEFGGA